MQRDERTGATMIDLDLRRAGATVTITPGGTTATVDLNALAYELHQDLDDKSRATLAMAIIEQMRATAARTLARTVLDMLGGEDGK